MNQEDKIFFEGMTSVSAVIAAMRAGNARRRLITVYFDAAKKRDEFRRLNFLKRSAEELGFDVCLVPTEEIEKMVSGHTHGGICAWVSSAEYPELNGDSIPVDGFGALIEGAEDPYSLGYSIRSLYAAGADFLLLPRRMPDGADAVVARASAGTSELLPIFVCDPVPAAELLISRRYRAVCAGIRDSVPCCDADLRRPLLIAIGGEKRGLSASLTALCSATVRIPYGRDFMGSLSTASSVAVLAYEIMRQNRSSELTPGPLV